MGIATQSAKVTIALVMTLAGSPVSAQSAISADGQTTHLTLRGSRPERSDSRPRGLRALLVLRAARGPYENCPALRRAPMVANKPFRQGLYLNEQYW